MKKLIALALLAVAAVGSTALADYRCYGCDNTHKQECGCHHNCKCDRCPGC